MMMFAGPGKCAMVVSEALSRPTFHQVFALQDCVAELVDYGGGQPDLITERERERERERDLDLEAVDRNLLLLLQRQRAVHGGKKVPAAPERTNRCGPASTHITTASSRLFPRLFSSLIACCRCDR